LVFGLHRCLAMCLLFFVNKSEHIFGFLFVILSLSHLHRSNPRFLLVFLCSPAGICTASCFLMSMIFLVSLHQVVVSALQFNTGNPRFLLVFLCSPAGICTASCFLMSMIFLVSLHQVVVSALQFNTGTIFLLASGPLGPIQFHKLV
jgi:hypothetical protein